MCCAVGDVCCGDECCDPERCCGNGECCAEECEECLDNGSLSGGTVSVVPQVVCIGQTIIFSVDGVVDSGGLKRVDCSSTIDLPAVEPSYTWVITKPDSTTESGSGASANVTTDQAGVYSCTFTANADRECPPADLELAPAVGTADELVEVTVEAEDGLIDCMEGRVVTFTATVEGVVPESQKPIEYTFHFEHADGTPWTHTIVSHMLQVDYDAIASQVPEGNPDHFFDTPIYVEVQLQACDPVTSDTLDIRVYELWINDFRHHASGRDWQVVVGEAIEYAATASSDCTSWDWDMEDGFPDVWNPSGGNAKTGANMVIPFTDLPGLDGDDFGDEYGTVNVFCEDGEGNNHRVYSADLAPPRLAKVFSDPALDTSGSPPNQSSPPCWFLFWQNGACPDLDEFEYRHMNAYGESQVIFGWFWDTHILRVGIPAGGTHYPNGLLINGVQYGGASGIDCCAEVVVHEMHHNVLSVEINDGATDTDPANPPAAPHIGVWLPDAREPGLGCSNANKDTFNLAILKAPVYIGYGDNEYSAVTTAHGSIGVAAKDWSKGGKQW